LKTISYFFIAIIVCLSSCTWHSMYLDPVSQPIYFGTSFDPSAVDSLGIISGLSVHEEEGESITQTRNVTFSFGGKDYTTENINSAISTALQVDPNRFIANGQIVVEIEHGISTGAIFSSILATIITEEDSELGHYTDESIYFRGIVYKLKNQEN